MKPVSSTVALARCQDYEIAGLKATVDRLLRALAFSAPRGRKVLLKPNLVAARRLDDLAVTHPQVVRAVAEWLVDHGAMVSVGDSPAFGSGRAVMEQCGMVKALAGLPVRFPDFGRLREFRTAGQLAVTLAAEVFQHDLLLNLPKLKAHGQLRVSMAVKNYFGLVVAWRKALAHMRLGDDARFARLLVDLLELLPEGVSLIDGVLAMHRRGPMDGEPLAVGVLGASRNPVALDTAMLAVIGLPPDLSPLWLECARRGLAGSCLTDLAFPLARPEDLAVTGFEVPAQLDPIRFQLWRFVRNGIRKLLVA